MTVEPQNKMEEKHFHFMIHLFRCYVIMCFLMLHIILASSVTKAVKIQSGFYWAICITIKLWQVQDYILTFSRQIIEYSVFLHWVKNKVENLSEVRKKYQNMDNNEIIDTTSFPRSLV